MNRIVALEKSGWPDRDSREGKPISLAQWILGAVW
jgi:hypothetical protein